MIHTNTPAGHKYCPVKMFLPLSEGSGGQYSRLHSHACVFGGGRGKVGIGGFGLHEERSTEGTKVRGRIERFICVDDGCVWFALTLQHFNGCSIHTALSQPRHFNQTK